MTSGTVADVVFARLQALRIEANPFGVFDALVPSDPPDRYLVLYADPGARSYVNLACLSDELRFTWQITSVGTTRPETEWLAARARDDLVDLVLEVDGLECEAIEHAFTQPIKHDTRIPNRVLLYGVDQYEMTAQPVPLS